jgi:hypothetical protein
MPVAANYNVLRVDQVEVTYQDLVPVKIADFTLPAAAVTHPAVLTSMVYPGFNSPIDSRFRFTALLNDRELFSDIALFVGKTVLFHGQFVHRCTSLTSVIPVLSPPILRGGTTRSPSDRTVTRASPESAFPTSFSGGSRSYDVTIGPDPASSCPSPARPAATPASWPSPRRLDPRARSQQGRGQQDGLGLSRAGDRRLNHALYMMAMVQVRRPSPGQAYYQRKLAEGKSPKEALRCLKRRMSDAVYRCLVLDQRLRRLPVAEASHDAWPSAAPVSVAGVAAGGPAPSGPR